MPDDQHPVSQPAIAMDAVTTMSPPSANSVQPLSIPPDATEEELLELRLHGKSPNTIRAYRPDVAAFRACIPPSPTNRSPNRASTSVRSSRCWTPWRIGSFR
ncbi:MAG TPA: hypothetical protein VGZ00_09585 [Candidatus Baltobacteraceae bacterium]|jgi:hypothetical protein|nr:hypothetical protein [Candidatus Baltobacteraceae bacterium]